MWQMRLCVQYLAAFQRAKCGKLRCQRPSFASPVATFGVRVDGVFRGKIAWNVICEFAKWRFPGAFFMPQLSFYHSVFFCFVDFCWSFLYDKMQRWRAFPLTHCVMDGVLPVDETVAFDIPRPVTCLPILSVWRWQTWHSGVWHAFRYNVGGRAKGADKHI